MSYDRAQQAAEFVRNRLGSKINEVGEIGIICGSGLGGLADSLQTIIAISTDDIPHFVKSTVQGHAGKLVFGQTSKGTKVVCVQGRTHTYEGYTIEQTIHVVRVLHLLGVKILIVTNAAGGVNREYKVGDLMVISDHLNIPGMAGWNPLIGPNDERWGARFVPTNAAYDHGLRNKFFQVVDKTSIGRTVHEGVYAYLTGPTYETSAEVRMLSTIGADAVGMSTVPEAIAAVHIGMKVFGLSLITNVSIDKPPPSGREPVSTAPPEEPNHTEVVSAGLAAAKDVESLIEQFLEII